VFVVISEVAHSQKLISQQEQNSVGVSWHSNRAFSAFLRFHKRLLFIHPQYHHHISPVIHNRSRAGAACKAERFSSTSRCHFESPGVCFCFALCFNHHRDWQLLNLALIVRGKEFWQCAYGVLLKLCTNIPLARKRTPVDHPCNPLDRPTRQKA
jgi:hypothetical protein